MCKVCATHVTSNMHPVAACRDSCDNPILVKSLGLQIGSHWVPLIHASNIYIYIVIPQPVSSVDCEDRSRWSICHALAGCKLLSGCLKCCSKLSAKCRFVLTCAVLALSSCAVLPWLIESTPSSSTLTIFPTASFCNSGRTPSGATAPISGAQGDRRASKWPWAWRSLGHGWARPFRTLHLQ